jgi:hypothetical protein
VTVRKRLRWLTLIVGGVLICAILSALAYLAVPPHATLLASVRAQCSPLPENAYAACTAPTIRELITWIGRGLLIGTALVLAGYALHPWWVRRRRDLMPLEDDTSAELRSELSALAGSDREPTWLLAPYAYTAEGRAFGLPWRPYVRLDVGLGILFRTDRRQFRSVITRELERVRHRAHGARYLTAGCLVTLVAAAAAASPAARPASSIDACLLGYWTAAPRLQTMLLSDATAAVVANKGSIWSFTADGVATLYPGTETIRAVPYSGRGTIRWRVTAHQGHVDLTDPTVRATLTAPGGARRIPEPTEYALPPTYICTGDTTTTMADEYAIVLHRVGVPA